MVRTAVLVSGGGTNLQALIDAHGTGKIKSCVFSAVIASSPDCAALGRAKNAGIPGFTINIKDYPDRGEYTRAVLNKLRQLDIELVVLAGFMFILGRELTDEYRNRVINVHPSLVPSFCGGGFYGIRVHERALEYGVKVTGATVHFVSDVTDGGPIILQKAVEVLDGDTPKTLQRRVMEQAEWELLPRAVSLYCEGRLKVEGRRVLITEGSADRDL